MGTAKAWIAYDFLKQVLGLPDGTVLPDAGTLDEIVTGENAFAIVIRHADLPETPPGDPLPEILPQFKTTSAVAFVDWGTDE